MFRSTHPPGFPKRLLYLAVIRTLSTAFMLGSAMLFQIQRSGNLQYHRNLTAIIVANFVFTGIQALWLKSKRGLVIAAYTAFAFDAWSATAQIYLTGLFESPFNFLWVIASLFGGVVLGKRGGLGAAGFNILGIVWMAGYGERSLNTHLAPWFWNNDVVYQSIMLSLGVLGSGLLSGILAERLEDTQHALAQSIQDLKNVKNLHLRILESLDVGILTLDLEEKIHYLNPSAAQILNRESSEILGLSLRDLGLYTPKIQGSWTQNHWEVHLQIRNQTRILSIQQSLLRDIHKHPIGKVIAFKDLTEFRRIEEALRERERLATLGHFAARMAHEIRNPLTSIYGAIELLAMDLPEEEKPLLDIVLKEIDRLNGLLKKTLQYARPQRFESFGFDLVPVIKDSQTLFLHGHPEIEIELELPKEAWVQAHPETMKQIFVNLFKNAVEAQATHLTLQLLDKGNHWELLIGDNGKGIPTNIRNQIFEPFFSTKAQGHGLGLSTVKQILLEQGGAIELLESSGTLFQIKLNKVPKDE